MISKLRKLVGRECIEWRMGRARCFKRTETVRAQTNILISFEPSLIDYVIQRFRERARGGGGGDRGERKKREETKGAETAAERCPIKPFEPSTPIKTLLNIHRPCVSLAKRISNGARSFSCIYLEQATSP